VIYMTGNEDPAIRKAAVESGCIAFLTKPFSTTIAHRAAQESVGCPLASITGGRTSLTYPS